MNFRQGLTDAWALVATFVPKLLGFLLILLIGFLIAKAVQKAVNAVLEKVGFDRVVERGPVGQAMSKSKYDASDLIAKLLYYTVLLITLTVAFGTFGPNNPISVLLQGLIGWLPKLAIAILIIIVASAIAKGVKDLIEGMLGGLSYGKVLASAASIFILALGIIAALDVVEIAVGVTRPLLIAFLATIGAILAIGVGGGMIRPMERRWDGWLNTMEQESSNMRQNARPASEVARERQQQLQNQYSGQQQSAQTYTQPAGSGATAVGYEPGQQTYVDPAQQPQQYPPADPPGTVYR